VVDAVRCAAEVQRGIANRNAETPEDKRITFRVGINLGDVIAEPDDIYGDGVNVAARLEALAEPGGVCISRVVRDQIRDKLPYPFEDRGEQSVKNIARRNGRNYLAIRSVERRRPCRCPSPLLDLPPSKISRSAIQSRDCAKASARTDATSPRYARDTSMTRTISFGCSPVRRGCTWAAYQRRSCSRAATSACCPTRPHRPICGHCPKHDAQRKRGEALRSELGTLCGNGRKPARYPLMAGSGVKWDFMIAAPPSGRRRLWSSSRHPD